MNQTIEINGLTYKIGRFGYAYYLNDDEWIKSDKAPGFIEDAIEREKQKKLL